jgi:membrane protease YdiL (CAAX protease family)
MEAEHKNYSWIINAVLWMLFHIPFGFDLIILLLPTLFIIPFAVFKTKNTTVGIIIHAVLNGPMFIFISIGLIK